MYQLKETLGDNHSEVQNARYVSAMSHQLNRIKGELTRRGFDVAVIRN